MLKKILVWTFLVLLVLVGTGWLLADWLTPRAVGEPSQTLPLHESQTALDRAIVPLLAAHPGQSGAAMLIDGLDAFHRRRRRHAAADNQVGIMSHYGFLLGVLSAPPKSASRPQRKAGSR